MNKPSLKFIITFFVMIAILIAKIVILGNKNNIHHKDNIYVLDQAGYVSKEEMEEFGFRSADIHCDKETNTTLIPLRNALMNKDTAKVISFIKDNNLSVDVRMLNGKTPLMYSSFYNDTNTTNKLIELGANVHIKDRYKLNALAYAISIDSSKTVKILLDNNLTMQETPIVQMYGSDTSGFYNNIYNIVIDGDDIKINYGKSLHLFKCGEGRFGDGLDTFSYIVQENIYNTAKVILESGYKPTKCDFHSNVFGQNCYKSLTMYENFEPMLDLLLKYNVKGQPSKEDLKKGYEECVDGYVFCIINRHSIKVEKDGTYTYFMRSYPYSTSVFQKHCTGKKGTFNTVKEYISYLNDLEKAREITTFLYGNNPNKKVIFKDKNQTEYIVKPYKELTSDDIKEVADAYNQPDLPQGRPMNTKGVIKDFFYKKDIGENSNKTKNNKDIN